MVFRLFSVYFDIPLISIQKKQTVLKFKVIDPEIYSISIFLEKDLGIVSPPHFVYDF